MTAPPVSEGIALLAASLVPHAVVVFFVVNRRLARLDGAVYLVLWGLVIVIAEHAGFGQARFGGSFLATHEGFHFQMLATYGLAAFALTGIVIVPLMKRGDRLGWYGLLILTVIGAGAEVITAAITTPHGVAPRWWSWGLALWAYPLAWLIALILSRRPIFASGSSSRSAVSRSRF